MKQDDLGWGNELTDRRALAQSTHILAIRKVRGSAGRTRTPMAKTLLSKGHRLVAALARLTEQSGSSAQRMAAPFALHGTSNTQRKGAAYPVDRQNGNCPPASARSDKGNPMNERGQ